MIRRMATNVHLVLDYFSTSSMMHIITPFLASPRRLMPTSYRLKFSHDVYDRHLSLGLLTLQILISTKSCCSSEKNDNIETDAHA